METTRSNALQDRLLEFPLHLVTLIVGCGFTVQVQESTEIELGRLEELDLADMDLDKKTRINIVPQVRHKLPD